MLSVLDSSMREFYAGLDMLSVLDSSMREFYGMLRVISRRLGRMMMYSLKLGEAQPELHPPVSPQK